MAAPTEQSVEKAKPEKTAPKTDADLAEMKVERPVQLEKTVPPAEKWTEAKHGVLGQFVEAPSVLAPINPAAKPEAGWGAANLSRDTVTARVMGLHLLKFEF
jgi:hypothetical protein